MLLLRTVSGMSTKKGAKLYALLSHITHEGEGRRALLVRRELRNGALSAYFDEDANIKCNSVISTKDSAIQEKITSGPAFVYFKFWLVSAEARSLSPPSVTPCLGHTREARQAFSRFFFLYIQHSLTTAIHGTCYCYMLFKLSNLPPVLL